MVNIFIVCCRKKTPADVIDGEALREKVEEITKVRKQDQKLVLNGHLLRECSDFLKFYNPAAPFNNVYVLGTPSTPKSVNGYECIAFDPSVISEDSAELSGLDWNETCSRVVDSCPLFQPFYSCRNKLLCVCCATFCHGHESPSLSSSIGPAQCQCCELGECLFSERYASGKRSWCLGTKHFEDSLALAAYECHSQNPKYSNLKRTIAGINAQVCQYEDKTAQALALSVVPPEEIGNLADQIAFEKHLGENDARICAYLCWFKQKFFSWVDKPPCARCSGPTANCGNGEPTPEERGCGAGRVELYSCNKCPGVITRFPRYNDPKTLLKTRRGFDVRIVHDVTDHVWTEIYSEDKKRWIHCDPCEEAFDKPLTYEIGWKKKLMYCIAFSASEVLDVTLRYTNNHDEVVKRRAPFYNVPERVYFAVLGESQYKKLTCATQKQQQVVLERQARDIQVMLEGKYKSGDNTGRISGSEQWKRERGEIGDPQCSCDKKQTFDAWAASRNLEKLLSIKSFDAPSCERLSIVGSAHLDAAKKSLVITENRRSQCGAAWFEVDVETLLKSGVVAAFRYVITDPLADGFAFVLQASGPTALGSGGAQLGYGGIPCSVAVEFDNYLSQDSCEDPNDNHVSINTRYERPNTAHHAASLAMCTEPADSISDGKAHDVVIAFIAEMIEVWFDSKHIIHLHKWDMERIVNGKQRCWVGFTGATGGLSQRLDILSFDLSIIKVV